MPWHQTDPVNERLKFVADAQRGHLSMTELCEKYGISRKTGYKLLSRYEADGPSGLSDRSRARLEHPNKTPGEVEAAILRVRGKHPTWGSKKIIAVLAREKPNVVLPARSTVDEILKRAGLVEPRTKRERRHEHAPPVAPCVAPNDLWSMDYKGWFRVADGTRCDPLTVNDGASRFSLDCRALVRPKTADVQHRLTLTFREFGLPNAFLSDNGPPFGSTGLAGFSRLSVWLVRAGVRPVLIEPGRPDQNGRHERFHETLKAETASPPRSTIRSQQAAFDRFQACYNDERPHEALDMKTPREVYKPSTRELPSKLEEHVYASDLEVRRVRPGGSIKWKRHEVFVGAAFEGELIGLDAVDECNWSVHLGPIEIGYLHDATRVVLPAWPEAKA